MRPLNSNTVAAKKLNIGFNSQKLAESIDEFAYFWTTQKPEITQDEAWELWKNRDEIN